MTAQLEATTKLRSTLFKRQYYRIGQDGQETPKQRYTRSEPNGRNRITKTDTRTTSKTEARTCATSKSDSKKEKNK